jgi:addiction module HigA family antidote
VDAPDIEDVSDVMNAPPHPADFLNEVLMPATGRSDGEIARLLGISLQVFYTILTREKPISPTTAAMLGRLFNTGEAFWLKMQAEYDRFVAPQNIVDSDVVPSEAAQARPSSMVPAPGRRLPKPPPGSFPTTADLSATDFPPRAATAREQLMQGNSPGLSG